MQANQRTSCGYQGHVCGLKLVQFISRFYDVNDYCVNGTRVSLSDSGVFERGTKEDYEAVRLFVLNEYANYLRSRNDFRLRYDFESPIQPITAL